MNRPIGIKAVVCALVAGVLANVGLADGTQFPSEWESLDIAGLVQLGEDLRAAGPSAAGQRMLLGDYIAGKHMSDVASTRTVPIERWRYLGRALRDDISPDTRKVWTSMLCKAFDDSDETIDALSVQEMVDLRNALWWVGHDAPFRHTPKLTERIESSTDWHLLKPLDLAGLVFPLRDVGASGTVARQRLAEHITSKYFADVAATRSMPLEQWRWLVKYLEKEFSPEMRRIWIAKLKEAFTSDPVVLASLSSKDGKHLADALRWLGAKEVDSLGLSWLNENRGTWSQRSAGDLASMAVVAVKENRSELASLMPELDRLWAAAHEEGPLGATDYRAIVHVWAQLGNRSKAQEWGLRAYQSLLGSEEARASANSETIIAVGTMFWKARLTGRGKGYTAFAGTVVDLAAKRQLKLEDPFAAHLCSLLLLTPETRQTIRDGLADEKGNVRLPLAKLLGWASRHAGELMSWRSFLDQKLSVEGMAGDRKAGWLLARAHAESLVGWPALSEKLSPRRGKLLLDSALAAASSPSTQLAVVREMVAFYEAVKRPDLAFSMLDSVKGQFTGEEFGKVELWRREVKVKEENRQEALAAAKAEREKARREALLGYYRKRLALAEKRDDGETSQRLRGAIQELSSE